MEDLYNAGGLATILRELKPLLRADALTVTGRTLGEELASANSPLEQKVVHTLKDPVFREGGIAVLRGNLAPDGAIIKQSAASEKLMQHTGRAVVFESLEDLAARIDDDALDVRADDILVLKNAGPKGAPGMPEAGYIPIPRKLAQAGVKDMPDLIANLGLGFATALSPMNLLLCFIGVLVGTLVGVLPGVGPIATIAMAKSIRKRAAPLQKEVPPTFRA